MTGAGVAITGEDAEEVRRRFEALEAEMGPRSELARNLVNRVALLTLRLDRSAEHEAKAISHRMRRATAEFDDARLAEVDRMMAWIAAEPVTHARRLRKTPEGIDRLIAAVEGLRADLARVGGHLWSYEHAEQLHHLLGKRSIDLPVTRVRALTEAIIGNFCFLRASDGEGLATEPRRVWAIGELVDLMDDEVEALRKLRDELDLEGIELDRSEAASRAIFDTSKEAVLARKYESANERGFFRTLREFREVQAETPVEPEVAAELGSFSPETPGEEIETADVDSTEPGGGEMVVENLSEDDPGAAEAPAIADSSDPTGG